MPGELDRLQRDALLHAAVAGEADDVMVEDRVLLRVEARRGHLRGDRHADRVRDALPERAGGRLDAVGVCSNSGWPGVFEPSWRKRFTSSSDSSVAAEVQPP